MKKKKLTLENINVQSFVTTLGKDEQKAVMGGATENTHCNDTNYMQCNYTCGGFMGDGKHFPYCPCPNPTSEIIC